MPESCMYEAVKYNDIEAVRTYYQEHPGRLDDIDDGGYTILMEAAKQGRLEIVKCLVELWADINAYSEIIDHYSDQRGTPLTFALEEGNRDVAIYLIQKGADTKTAYYYREDEQTPYSEPSVHSTCFMYAMDRSDLEMLELMLQNGFDINGFNA
jgi:ankyrin repeat protein